MTEKRHTIKISKNDQDEESLISPCFQISNEVELKEIPSTGEEYLLKVINERRRYSTVSKCNIDCSTFLQNQSRFVNEIPHPNVPEILKPTIEWQNIQVADFSDNRLYISRLLNKMSHWPKKVIRQKLDPRSNEEWNKLFENHEPTLSCILGLNHKKLDSGLEILIDTLNNIKPGSTIAHKTGQWIYAILACTRQPLLPDTTSILRNLARKCAEVRSHINPQDNHCKEFATPLNVFICLVARYFQQFDLAD